MSTVVVIYSRELLGATQEGGTIYVRVSTEKRGSFVNDDAVEGGAVEDELRD